MKLCTECHEPISDARITALPHTTVCVECSTEQPVRGLTIWPHKTGSYIEVLPSNEHSRIQDYDRRGMKTAAKVENRNPVSVGMSQVGRSARVEGEVVNHVPARCHPSQPRVSASGHCLACAMQWYQHHAK